MQLSHSDLKVKTSISPPMLSEWAAYMTELFNISLDAATTRDRTKYMPFSTRNVESKLVVMGLT